MRNDDDIRTQQRKLEGVAAPLGEGSENSQLLQKLLYEGYTGTKHTTRRTIFYVTMTRSRFSYLVSISVYKCFVLQPTQWPTQ